MRDAHLPGRNVLGGQCGPSVDRAWTERGPTWTDDFSRNTRALPQTPAGQARTGIKRCWCLLRGSATAGRRLLAQSHWQLAMGERRANRSMEKNLHHLHVSNNGALRPRCSDPLWRQLAPRYPNSMLSPAPSQLLMQNGATFCPFGRGVGMPIARPCHRSTRPQH